MMILRNCVQYAAALTLATASMGFAQTSAPAAQQFKQTNLAADSAATAGSASGVTIDPQLLGAWGISQSSSGPWWVADRLTGLSTLYNGVGAKQSLVVTIPPANPNGTAKGMPTGVVFNGSPTSFVLPDGKPATFIFDTLDGTIAGWNSSVANNVAETVVNQGPASGFTGLAIADAVVGGVTAPFLYAADNKAAKLSVFDTHFQHVPAIEDAIAAIGPLDGFSPFGVHNVGGNLFVTLRRADKTTGPGLGVVVAITPQGKLIGFLQGGSNLNAPWGVAEAPGNFGNFSHDLLVGNNGDGKINVFNPQTGQFIATLVDANNKVIEIPGLWGLNFGNDTANGGPATTLFFAADLAAKGGLFGTLTPIQNTLGSDQ